MGTLVLRFFLILVVLFFLLVFLVFLVFLLFLVFLFFGAFGVFVFFCVFGVFFFGFLVEQHLTAKRWEGFGTAPDSKEMGREMGYGRGGVPYIYMHETWID